ncbi:hypothetical protein KM043_006858 [Ampulex compressa]|nr:hypothetical protein KM043_006858 [Ampulex compressa]
MLHLPPRLSRSRKGAPYLRVVEAFTAGRRLLERFADVNGPGVTPGTSLHDCLACLGRRKADPWNPARGKSEEGFRYRGGRIPRRQFEKEDADLNLAKRPHVRGVIGGSFRKKEAAVSEETGDQKPQWEAEGRGEPSKARESERKEERDKRMERRIKEKARRRRIRARKAGRKKMLEEKRRC